MVAQFLAHKPVNSASSTRDRFIVSFSKLLGCKHRKLKTTFRVRNITNFEKRAQVIKVVRKVEDEIIKI